MAVEGDTLIGDEWIIPEQEYYAFTVFQDGVYRIPYESFIQNGISPSSLKGDEIRVFRFGKQIPLFVSTNETFDADDYIEFVGHKNRGEIDRFLYLNPDEDMLNPQASCFTDTSTYYITFSGTSQVRRVLNFFDAPTLPTKPYHLSKSTLVYVINQNDPYFALGGGGSVSYSSFQKGEGFARFNENNSASYVFTPNISPVGPDPLLHVKFAGTNYGNHRIIVSINSIILDTIHVKDLNFVDTVYPFPLSELVYQNTVSTTRLGTQSRHTVVELGITYPRTSDYTDSPVALITVPPSVTFENYLIKGMVENAISPAIYSYTGDIRYHTNPVNEDEILLSILAPSEADLILAKDQSGIDTIRTLTKKVFHSIKEDNPQYIIISHPALMASGAVEEYAAYRRSEKGGSYRVAVYSIEDLYDRFAYGIKKHPIAIRNLVTFAQQYWPDTEMFFIIGRGIEYHRSRYPDGIWEKNFFVPTFGRPGSDVLLTSTPWEVMPRFPIGRLAVTNDLGIREYLLKIKEHESLEFSQSIESRRWLKNVMHIGGGQNEGEQESFKTYLQSLGEILENSSFGGNIHFFQKQSTEHVEQSQSTRILDLLNEGCSIINYFGHSGTTTFEYNIQDPSQWNNRGRYSIVSAMGCSAGQIFGPANSLSDIYVHTPKEGAIAFISSSGNQFSPPLHTWSKAWYQFIGNEGYNRPLGEGMMAGLSALRAFVSTNTTNLNQYRFLLEQQIMQGDPAIHLHVAQGPDYLPHRSRVSIDQQVLSAELDSIDIRFTIYNIGRNENRYVPFSISLFSSDGIGRTVLEDSVKVIGFEKEVYVKVPFLLSENSSSFRLHIHVDPENLIAELPQPDAETNNELTDETGLAGINYFVSDNIIFAVYPGVDAIVNDLSPLLTASGPNVLDAIGQYVLQIDTTERFNSPLLYHGNFTSDVSSQVHSIPYPWEDDQVYFWRVSPDSISETRGYKWDQKNFTYAPSLEGGFDQQRFSQFATNEKSNLNTNTAERKFEFVKQIRNISLLNRYLNISENLRPQYVEEGIIRNEFFATFRDQKVHLFVVVFDSLSGNYLNNPPGGKYGSFNNLSYEIPCFPFRTDSAQYRQQLISFLEDTIEKGSTVLVYPYQRTPHSDYFPEEWDADKEVFGKDLLTTLGIQAEGTAIEKIKESGSVPFILYYRKGSGLIEEFIADDTTGVISLILDINRPVSKASMFTPLIGPALEWTSISHRLNRSSADDFIMVEAYSKDLSDTLIVSSRLTQQDTMLSDLDASLYPYLRLIMHTADSINFVPAQPLHFRVAYKDKASDYVAITPYQFQHDTIFQGDTLILKIDLENIAAQDQDSVGTTLRIVSNENAEIASESQIAFGPIIRNEYKISTINMQGSYKLLYAIDPTDSAIETDKRNNIGYKTFFVVGDDVNPLLDVTFDGYHIKDGDLVSYYPEILITLLDENERRRLSDTSLFEISLEYPSDFEPQRVYFSSSELSFNPASATGLNRAQVLLNPLLTEDGFYTLVVKAKDASGNVSGDTDYQIRFRVDFKETFAVLLAYPNPFSQTTQFSYTLTGKGNPAEYYIEIANLSGQIVDIINMEEIGALPAGSHTMRYEWDGTNQNGSPLPSGLYFYRMVVKDENGEYYLEANLPPQAVSSRKGWNKIVIIR